MLSHTVSSQFSSPFKIDLENQLSKSQRGQTVGEYGIVLTGVLIVGILIGVYYFFSSQTQCERRGLSDAECIAAAGADFPYADGKACFTLQDSLELSKCQFHGDCLQLPAVGRGSYNAEKEIEIVVINAGVMHYLFEDRLTIDGCYDVTIDGVNVTWESNSGGSHCDEIRSLQLWNIPLCKIE